ncbi:unnamed protein product [Symbiodinium sp. CCMP2592]|nr:unnamed protein product [Symbiodinium sp. CCMP2592]
MCFALPFALPARIEDLAARVRAEAFQQYPGLHFATPVAQQRHNGYADFVLHSAEDDRRHQVAVIVDLSRVGGHYHASTQPAALDVDAFLDQVLPHTWADDCELRLWISGAEQGPAAGGKKVQITHGDVLTVLREGVSPAKTFCLHKLVEGTEPVGAIHHMPSYTCKYPGIAVLWHSKLFVLHKHYFPGQDLVSALGTAIRRPVQSFGISQTDAVARLEIAGDHCSQVIYVADSTANTDHGQDPALPALGTIAPLISLLCDARQIGQGMRVLEIADQASSHEILESLGVQGDLKDFVVAPAVQDNSHEVEQGLQTVIIWERPTAAAGSAQLRAISGPNLLQRLYQGDAGPVPGLIHQPAEDPVGPNGDNDQDLWVADVDAESDEESLENELFPVNFLVVRLDCAPIEVNTALRMPATVADAMDAVALSIDHEVYLHYPHFVAAKPQPQSEWGTALALPHWAHREPIVIFDLRQIDGRIFAASLPEHANAETICAAASTPFVDTVAVYPYGVTEPLAADETIEPRTGGSILLLPRDRRPPDPHFLVAMLVSRRGWNADTPLPRGPGWQLLIVENRVCSHTELVEHFATFMPEGYQPQIDGAPVDGDRVELQPGTVLTVQYVPLTSASENENDSSSQSSEADEPAAETNAGETDQNATRPNTNCGRSRSRSPRREGTDPRSRQIKGLRQVLRRAASQLLLAKQLRKEPPDSLGRDDSCIVGQCLTVASIDLHGFSILDRCQAHRDGVGAPPPNFQVDRPDQFADILEATEPFDACFVVFRPDYSPEIVEVRLGAPSPLMNALAAVSEARTGFVLAQPDWEFLGVHVLFDCSDFDGIQEGDCISIMRAEHGVMILASLADMLLSAQGWMQTFDIPGDSSRGLWVMTDTEPFHYAIQPDRAQHVRQDIADHIACPVANLRLCPTTARTRRHLHPICILDLRPLLLGLTWQFTADGYLDQEALMRRLAMHRPLGFELVLESGGRVIDPEVINWAVHDGELLTVRARPEQHWLHNDSEDREGPQSPDDHLPPEDSDSERQDIGNRNADTSNTGTDAQGSTERGGYQGDMSINPVSYRKRAGMSRVKHCGNGPFGAFLSRALGALAGAALVHTNRAMQLRTPPFSPTDTAMPPASNDFAAQCRAQGSISTCLRHVGSVVSEGLSTRPRALPTPCRNDTNSYTERQAAPYCHGPKNWTSVPVEDETFLDEVGVTLLQAATREAQHRALWETHTLLETLIDHFASSSDLANKSGSPAAGPAQTSDELADRDAGYEEMPQCVSIAKALGPAIYDLTDHTVRLPHDQSLVEVLRLPWPVDWFLPTYEHLPMPQETRAHLDSGCSWSTFLQDLKGAEKPSLAIYTDGSWTENRHAGGYATAFVLNNANQHCLIGALSGKTHGSADNPWPTEQAAPALRNEEIAIVAAILWLLQSPIANWFQDVTICFDCLSAGNAANGEWTPATEFGTKLRDLQRWADNIFPAPILYHHVKAHNGHPLNELVGYLAKVGAADDSRTGQPPRAVVEAFVQLDLSWLSAAGAATASQALPVVNGQFLQWTQAQSFSPCKLAPSDIIPMTEVSIGASGYNLASLEVKFATINIQGLQDKTTYLEEQFDFCNLNIVCIQEAKTPPGVCCSKRFLRLSTPSARHFGTSVWINRRLGIATSGGQPIRVTETFIAQLAQALRQHKRAALVIGGCDLNGRPPPHIIGVTGDLECGDPDESGREAAEPFQKLQLWMPTTFGNLHVGTSYTYRHPAGTQHRIDFPVVGGRLIVEEIRTEVSHDVDLGNARDDHFLVTCQLRGALGQTGAVQRLWRPRYDVDAMMTPEGHALIAAEMKHFVSPQWTVHPDEHCRQITQKLQQIMKDHFQKPANAPRASFIPGEIWEQREAKLGFKNRTRHRASLWQDLLVRAFKQWQTCNDYSVTLLVAKEGILYQVAAAAVRFATWRIRKGIRQAKATCLKTLVLRNGARSADILSAAKKAGIGGAKVKKPFRPMPHLLKADGTSAANRQDRDEVRLDHFGQQECGHTVAVDKFLLQPPQPLLLDAELDWRSEHVPSAGALEAILRSMPRHKAAGLDSVPGELLRAAPGPMSQALHPLMVKSMLCLRQPLQWRGGILFEAWKHHGSQRDASSYRSLYVASVVGKAYHKLQRRMVQSEVQQSLHAFHLGAKKNTPVVMPALYVLASQRAGEAQQMSTAVLFLDTHAAYYRLVRDLALGSIYDDVTVIRLFRHFGLDEEELQELMEVVRSGGTFADNAIPATIRHAAKDTHHHTWFVTPHTSGTLLCKTEAGSRPGESWADTVYSFIYSRILSRIAEYAHGECLLPDFSHDAASGIFAPKGGGEGIGCQDATWADDSAWPLIAHSPAALLAKAGRLASIVLSQCRGHGMQPNLGRNKTALMFQLRGKGAVRAQRECFSSGKASLRLADLDVDLPVTNQYKHLGGLIDSRLSLAGEARRRLAVASQAFDQGKALLFLNDSIPLETRASLLQVAVTSTYHNLPIWIPEGRSWEMLQSGYTRLVRKLLSKRLPGEHLFRMPAALAHVITGCFPLDFLARKARLSLLCSMCKAGPAALWAALQEEQSWFATVRSDLEWLCDKVRHNWPLRCEAAWPEWSNLLRTRPDWFKAQVKAGLQREFVCFERTQAVYAALWALHKRAQPAVSDAAPVVEAQWFCPPCAKCLKTKAALAAHFFKTHGRRARYRAVVQGTLCRACGRQYWSSNRLARHLRDSPSCVAALRANRLFSDTVVPGFGSAAWRRNDIEHFNPTGPQQQTAAMPKQSSEDWDGAQRQAHAELSDALLSEALPASPCEIARIIRATLAKFPLFEDEAKDLAEFVLCETREVRDVLLAESWSDEVASAVDDAMQQVLLNVWESPEDVSVPERPLPKYRDLEFDVQGVSWDSIWAKCSPVHGTPSGGQYVLPSDWEAELLEGVRRAVQQNLWSIVPKPLQLAWTDILKGYRPHLAADASFWRLTLAKPFWPLAPELAT